VRIAYFCVHFRDFIFSLLACEEISVLFFDSENMVTLPFLQDVMFYDAARTRDDGSILSTGAL